MSRRDEWLVEPLGADVRRALDRLERVEDVERVAVLPDVHLAHEVCVGTVVGTRTSFLPAAVGGDIGCGMSALELTADPGRVVSERSAARLLAAFEAAVPILRHPRETAPLPEELSEPRRPLSARRLDTLRARLAARQLGTLGRGNHFLELQADEHERLWLMVHSGSRGMGQAIRAHHEERARASPGELVRIEADSTAGRDYWNDMRWALDYASANRARISSRAAEAACEILDCELASDSPITCHHNFVRPEVHDGQPYWVHRKGAISAAEGELGLVPGSMGTASYHVEGRGSPRSLCSCSHGAGRRLSRGGARAAVSTRQVGRELSAVFFDRRLTSKLRDEAPSAYKDIDAVIRAQKDLLRVRRKLRPILSFKGV